MRSNRQGSFRLFQQDSFNQQYQQIQDKKPLHLCDSLRKLYPFLDENGLLRVGGRLNRIDLPNGTKHPVLLHHKSPIVKMFCSQLHKTAGHPGPGTFLAILAECYYIIRGRKLAKGISKKCITCQKAYTRTQWGSYHLHEFCHLHPLQWLGRFCRPFYRHFWEHQEAHTT